MAICVLLCESEAKFFLGLFSIFFLKELFFGIIFDFSESEHSAEHTSFLKLPAAFKGTP